MKLFDLFGPPDTLFSTALQLWQQIFYGVVVGMISSIAYSMSLGFLYSLVFIIAILLIMVIVRRIRHLLKNSATLGEFYLVTGVPLASYFVALSRRIGWNFIS